MKSIVVLVCILILFAMWEGFINMILIHEITTLHMTDRANTTNEEMTGNIASFHKIFLSWYYGPLVNIAGFISAILGVYYAMSGKTFLRRIMIANAAYIMVFTLSAVMCATPIGLVLIEGNFMKAVYAFLLFFVIMNGTSFYWGRAKEKVTVG